MLEITYQTGFGVRTVILRYTSDSPGLDDPGILVDDIINREPHFIFLVFDINRPLHEKNTRSSGTIDWFDWFCNNFYERTDIKPSVRKNLNGLAILLNKCDLIDAEDFHLRKATIEKEMSEKAEQKLQKLLGVGRENMEFYFCCLLEGGKMPKGDGIPSQLGEAINYMFSRLR